MSKSKWQSAIEILGIVAVVASLMLVAIELRQTQNAQIAESHSVRATRAIELTFLATELGLAEITEKYASGLELSQNEIDRATNFNRAFLWHYDDLYFQRAQGLINDATWESKLNGLRYLVNLPLFKVAFPDLDGSGYSGIYENSFLDLARSLQE